MKLTVEACVETDGLVSNFPTRQVCLKPSLCCITPQLVPQRTSQTSKGNEREYLTRNVVSRTIIVKLCKADMSVFAVGNIICKLVYFLYIRNVHMIFCVLSTCFKAGVQVSNNCVLCWSVTMMITLIVCRPLFTLILP